MKDINTRNWYKSLKKAPWTPPNKVFGIIWSFLYLLMGVAVYIIWKNNKCKLFCWAIRIFLIQLVFNFAWTTIFFKYKKPKLALLDLIIIIYLTHKTYYEFYKIEKIAAYLLLPYIAWLLVALSLNIYIVIAN
tara:strand:- start:263 stop:661 length:399 start_codon:yes stop_codon:yes gene_type:complete